MLRICWHPKASGIKPRSLREEFIDLIEASGSTNEGELCFPCNGAGSMPSFGGFQRANGFARNPVEDRRNARRRCTAEST